nr:MAG: putative polyprotein [Picornavirales sp.]
MAMESSTSTSTLATEVVCDYTRRYCLSKQQALVRKEMKFFYENGDSKPEDNTPLQAQQEDPVRETAPHELATGETTVTGVYPSQQQNPAPSLVSWTVSRTIDAEIPRIVSVLQWTSSLNPGDLLTNLPGSDNVEKFPSANPFLLPNSLFTYQDAQFQELNNPTAASGLFESLYVRHALFRSGYVVEATINGTQFHGGSMILVAIPVPHILIQSLSGQNPGALRSYTMFDVVNMAQLGIYPSVRILPRSNSAGRLVLPHVGNSYVLDTANADVQYALFAIVESKLSVPTGTAPTITLTLRVGAQNAEFYAPKSAQRIYTNILNQFRLPFDVPNPASYEAPTRIAPGQSQFVNTVSQSIQVSRRLPSVASTFLPARVEDFRSVLSRPTVLSLVEFTSATTVGTNLFQIQVAPTAVPIVTRDTTQALPANSVKRLTGIPYLAQFSRYFTQWRGSITYTLEYTGPAVSAGRLLLAFQPGRYASRKAGTATQYMETGAILQNYTEGEHIVWDLSNSTSVSLTCPYSLSTPWAPVTSLNDQNTVTSGTSSGTFVIAVLSPLLTPTVVAPTSDIIVHVSAGPDFELRYPAPISVNTIPIYNGVLDQATPDQQVPPGEKFVEISGDTNVEHFFSQSRFYGTFSAKTSTQTPAASQMTIPLSLITYAGTGTSAVPKNAEVPFRMFAGLFSFLKADLRITIGVPFSTNVMVSYRPPGITQSAFENTGAGGPDSAAALANGPAVILSTRANNMGTEIFIPFDSYAAVFQTSNNIAARFDTLYSATYSQVDPGDLGTLFVAARLPSAQLVNVSVFIALENVEAYVPRPFGPTTATSWTPALPTALSLPDPHSFSWEEVANADEEMPELEDESMEYQAPVLCETTGINQFDCPCVPCGSRVASLIRCFESGLELDDGGFAQNALIERGLLSPSTPTEEPPLENPVGSPESGEWVGGKFLTYSELRSLPLWPMTIAKARAHGWDPVQMCRDNPGWELESILDEIYWTELADEEAQEENLYGFMELPLDYPVGPEIPGTWIDGEFYRPLVGRERSSPYSGWHENPYSRALLNHDPSKQMRFYHYLWNDTRRALDLLSQGKLSSALVFVTTHPMQKMKLPKKLAKEFDRVKDMIEQFRSERVLMKDLAEVRATAFRSGVKASDLMRSALRRVSHRRLSNWEVVEVRKTTRFLCSLDSSDSEDDDFFEDDCELTSVSYEAPLGLLPAPPSNVGVRANTPRAAAAASSAGVVVSDDDTSEVDDEPPSRPYIYKVNRGIYIHWGLAYKNQAISLEQHGIGARVALTNGDLKNAQKWEEVGMYEWFRAVCMLGQEFEEYNVQNNCTHFVEVITGKKLSNTGTYLMLGLGAAAVATALIFQSPGVPKEKFVAMEQTPLSWDVPIPESVRPKKTTRWVRILKSIPKVREHNFRRTMFFGKPWSLPRKQPDVYTYEAPINIQLSNSRVERDAEASAHALRQTLQTHNDMAPQISVAVTQAAAALQDTSVRAGDFVNKLESLVTSTTDFLPRMAQTTSETAASLFSDCSRKIGSMILKIIGYTLIIFGNPNPATVAGVISLMAAEAMDSRFLRDRIKSLAVSLSHKLQSLFTSCFGLNVCSDDPEIFEDIPFNNSWSDYIRERENNQYEAPEPTATQSFNQTVLAMKNAEWIINKIKELIEFTIAKLKGKQARDPAGFLASRAEYMVKLYDDSVESGSCQNVDESLLKKRMQETSEMLSYCVNARLGQAASLLSKTLANYRTTQRKLACAAYQDRAEPLVVYIHGGPGCGKSVLSNLIASAFCKRENIPFSSSVFTTPPGSEFFDGYTGQPVHIIDDFCQNTTGEDVKLFCQMVSTNRFSPPMASLEEKGVNYVSKLIIATSNLATPQSNEVRIPAALERRCHIRVRAALHPAFSTPSGSLDMAAAFKELGPAKSPDFKVDCPYLNGAAVSFSVRAGGDRKSENLSVYELMDVIFDELKRRDGCQDLFRKVCYQAPTEEELSLPDYYKNKNIIPTLCSHQDHNEEGCHRVYFREGNLVWHKDFLSADNLKSFVEGFWSNESLPASGEIRPCPCLDPTCGKLMFFGDGESRPHTFDFRSKSLMDYFLFHSKSRYVMMDPTPVEFRPVAKPQREESVEELKKSLTKLQKASLISFSITALGTLASLIGAVVWLVRRNRQSNSRHQEAPYTGMPGGSRPRREHPRPIPTRNITYEGSALPQIYPKIENNTFSINFLRDGKFLFSLSGLGVAGRVALGNYHGFSRADQISIKGKTYNIEDLKPTRIMRNGHPTDLCVFTLPDGNEFKNITRFFLSVKDRIPRADCVLISRAEKMVCNFWCRNVAGKRTVKVEARDTSEEDTHHNVIVYDVPSMPGMCGAPLLSTNSAREVVLGIHFAGSGSTGMSVPVYVEDFKSFLEANLKPIPHPGKPTHVARKSDLKKSPVHGVFPVTHGPAALTNNDRRLEPGVNLDEVMFSKHRPDHPGWSTLEPAMAYVVDDLMNKLGFHPSEPIKMWTMEEAINGNGIMDGLMMNQSPGYPYNTQGRSRRSFFVWQNNRWEPTDELRREVERALEKPGDFFFSTFLKDEIRPLSKVTAGKTRIVDGDSLPRAIAYRMVFGSLFERMLAKHGPEIHSAVGCNPETFWTELFHKMGPANFPYVFDLDYSCFDSSEPAVSFRLMGKYLQPYFDYDISKYFEALAVSKHIYEGDAYEMEGGMPSGCVGTSMFNCINNSAFIVSALLALKLNPEDMMWICYGDDVIIATHEKALSRRIAEFYHANTPLVVTPASKSGEFPEVSTIYEVTFLKRYFQPDSNYPELIHPYMPLDHLKQSVMWCTDGPFQAKLDSLCFLAFHAGGSEYRDFVKAVDQKAIEKGLRFNFKPFEFLMAQWYANFM